MDLGADGVCGDRRVSWLVLRRSGRFSLCPYRICGSGLYHGRFKGDCGEAVVEQNLIDFYLLGSDGAPLRTAVIFFYIANEGVSLLENATAIGLPVPDKLKDVLAQLHGKDETK
jgi:hypothetical protein